MTWVIYDKKYGYYWDALTGHFVSNIDYAYGYWSKSSAVRGMRRLLKKFPRLKLEVVKRG